MTERETAGHRLRALLDRPNHVLAVLGVPSALQGKIMERAGIEAGFVGTSLTFSNVTGMSDTGMASANECVTLGGYIAQTVRFPVLLDGDTGHGAHDALRRLVRDCIRAGLAGIRLDDQPIELKRRTQSAGIRVVARDDAVDRYRVAVETRNEIDPSFVIMAQCYARDADNGSPEEAIERLRLYADEGGADWCQLEAPHDVEEIRRGRDAVKGYFSAMRGQMPRALTLEEHRQLGLDAAWYTFIPSRVLMVSSFEFLQEFATKGIDAWTAYEAEHVATLERLKEL